MPAKTARRLANYKGDLYHRHYCKVCSKRVFPYDGMEALTVAPLPGAKGGPILLFSSNAARRDVNPENVSRIAWCWSCNTWVETYRETRSETLVRYLRRRGIQIRFNGKSVPVKSLDQTKAVKALDARIEERRATTISLK